MSYVMLVNDHRGNVTSFFLHFQHSFMVPNWFLDNLQPFLVKPLLDQVPNKGFALLATAGWN